MAVADFELGGGGAGAAVEERRGKGRRVGRRAASVGRLLGKRVSSRSKERRRCHVRDAQGVCASLYAHWNELVVLRRRVEGEGERCASVVARTNLRELPRNALTVPGLSSRSNAATPTQHVQLPVKHLYNFNRWSDRSAASSAPACTFDGLLGSAWLRRACPVGSPGRVPPT